MLRRALEACAAEDPERLEGLAFSLYEVTARASASRSAIPFADVRMDYAKRLIRERSTEPTTIAAIALDLSLSRFAFTRRFLASVGTSPHAYMTSVRVERAKEALRRTALSIEEIAIANGFGSLAHFSSAFRRIVGCPPTAYRRAIAR